MKRFLLAVLLGFCLLLPTASKAQIDQKCWTRKTCEAQRKVLAGDTLTDSQIKSGFIRDNSTEASCGGQKWGKDDVGFCLPAGIAETKISFGGETKFSNIGVFIKSMYRYTIWVAGILAAAMLVVAGFQWAASGGNSDSISSAKNKIAGATSGLVILLLSYVILNTINPYLVSFRLPQIWLINGQGLAEYCSALPETDTVEFIGASEEKIQNSTKVEKFKNATFPTKPADAECGKQYLFSSGGGQSCKGSKCQAGNVCLTELESNQETCFIGNIAGKITNSDPIDKLINNANSWTADVLSGFVANFWEFPWVPDEGVLDNIRLLYICNNGVLNDVTSKYILKSSIKAAQQNYTLSVEGAALDEGIASCNEQGGFKGFALRVDFNNPNDVFEDEAHVIGRSAGGNQVDLGDLGTFSHIGHYDYSLPVSINKAAPVEYYMTKEQILQGIRLNIDSANVCTIFEDKKRRGKCYGTAAIK